MNIAILETKKILKKCNKSIANINVYVIIIMAF